MAKFTKFTSTDPAVLTKTCAYSERPDRAAGKDPASGAYPRKDIVTMKPGGQMLEGTFEVVQVADLEGFAEHLKSVTPAIAFAYGLPLSGASSGPVTTRNRSVEGAITRTRECMGYVDGPGIMFADYDPPRLPSDEESAETLTEEGLVQYLREAGVASDILTAHSASSWLYKPDGVVWKERSGLRSYWVVNDASHIPLAAEALLDRLWCAATGWTLIDKAGRLHDKCLIDGSVYQPERLDFVGGAALKGGMEQRRPEPRIWEGKSRTLDTRKCLTRRKADKALAERNRSSERERVERECPNHIADLRDQAAKRLNVSADAFDKFVEAHRTNRPVSAPPELTLQKPDGTEITVAEIIAKPEIFHGVGIRDPLEPDYKDGAQTAIIYTREKDGKPRVQPIIHSFAHGGYTLLLPRVERVDDWTYLLDRPLVKKGIGPPYRHARNAAGIFRHWERLEHILGWHVYKEAPVRLREWSGEPLPRPAPWTDADDLRALELIQGFEHEFEGHIFAAFGPEIVRAGVGIAALDNPIEPIRDAIEALPKWDGKRRLDNWLIDFAGVADTPLHRAYSRRFLIGLIARGLAVPQKSVKMDTALMLIGAQGTGKSQICAALAGDPELFTDRLGNLRRNEVMEEIGGKWVVEIAEGVGVTRGERETVRAFLSRDTDRYRAAYDRRTSEKVRHCIFIVTSNEDDVLADPEGSRRFWPVVAEKIDLAGFRAVREQLLAEARDAFDRGERWWLEPDEEALRDAASERFEQVDPWEETICEALEDVVEGQIVKIADILEKVLRKPTGGHNSGDARRVRSILNRLGWEKTKVKGQRGWRRSSLDTRPPISEIAKAAREKNRVFRLGDNAKIVAELVTSNGMEDGSALFRGR